LARVFLTSSFGFIGLSACVSVVWTIVPSGGTS
jgi:hypothetical protein